MKNLKFILSFCIITVSNSLLAQPINDDCNGAIELFPTDYCITQTGDVTGATQSIPGCSGTADDDVWYKFTATETIYKMNVTGSASFNPVIEFFSGNCSNLVSIECMDDNYGNGTSESLSLSNLIIGNEYFIRVYHYSSLTPTTKTFDICLSKLATKPVCGANSVPATDDCQSAEMICNFNGYCGNTSIYDAVNDPDGYNINTWPELTSAVGGININNNSFAKFVAISSTINFNLWVYNSSSNFGIQIAVLSIPTCGSGAVTNLYSENKLDPTGITDHHVISISGLTPGNTYYIMIDGYAGDVCDYTIGLPPNSGFATSTSVTPDVTDICLGSSISLYGAGGDGNYTWTSPDIADLNTSIGSTVIATPTTTGTKTYTVNSTNSNPLCPVVNSADAIVNVYATPSLSLTDTSICSGNSVNITANPTVLGGTYSWDNGGSTNTISVTPNSTTTYTLTYAVPSCPNSVESITVSVYNSPVIDFTVSNTNACLSTSIDFTNISTNATSYLWDFGDGITSSNANPSIEYTSIGSKTIKLIGSNPGCSDSITKVNFLTVNEKASAIFSTNTNQISTNDLDVVFYNNSIGADSYYWDFDDNTNSTDDASSITHTFPASQGNYYVKLVANNSFNCADSAELTITVNEELIYYVPNSFTPNNSDVHNAEFKPVFTSGYNPNSYTLTIFDRWGNVVFDSNNTLIGWDGTKEGKKLPIGTYSWRLHFEESNSGQNYNIAGNVNLIK